MKFTLDGEHYYDGIYCTDETDRWNGFATPRFTLDVAKRILSDIGATDIRMNDNEISWIDSEGEADGCPMDVDGFFPVGAYAWIWSDGE